MNENQLWQQICQEETLQLCQEYMAQFPNGPHAQVVNNKIKILQNPNDPRLARFLAQYLQNSIVTLGGLMKAGLDTTKAQSLMGTLGITEAGLWNKVTQQNTVQACNEYLSYFPDGAHAQQVRDIKARIIDGPWFDACQKNTKEAYEEYMRTYPGQHDAEAMQKIRALDADGDWRQACAANTIAAYEDFMRKHPGVHDAEARQFIDSIKNYSAEEEWKKACEEDTLQAYDEYLRNFPGHHTDEARLSIERLKKIEEERQANIAWMAVSQQNTVEAYEEYLRNFPGWHDEEARQIIIEIRNKTIFNQLKDNPNSLEARDIQQYLEDSKLLYRDLETLFGPDKAEAILNFNAPTDLPVNEAPDYLGGNTTEVYFWGTPSSGKTCALGGIISNAGNKGILEKLNCNGYDYMTRLSNIFDSKGYCTFPDSTAIWNIQDMMMRLFDRKNKPHRLTLVDLAGELFRSVYYKRHNLFLDEQRTNTLDKAMNYLRDTRNKKIHFFVVEYGAHDRDWEGLRMKDYLADMVGFLKEEQVFKKSTVGVYVLVTKCDLIGCRREERPQRAFEYVENELAAFWGPLKNVCKDTGVGDLKVLAYSVGDVFAQKLCKFDPSDTEKVIDKLLTKTPAEGGLFDWLRG